MYTGHSIRVDVKCKGLYIPHMSEAYLLPTGITTYIAIRYVYMYNTRLGVFSKYCTFSM